MDDLLPQLENPLPPSFWTKCFHQLLPPVCWNCQKVIHAQSYSNPAFPYLCSDCLIELPWCDPDYHCRQCANLTAESGRLRCPDCMDDHWDLDQARGGFSYDEQMRHWVIQLKFHKQAQLAPMLGRLLALSLQGNNWISEFDVLIPIPLHQKRLRQRGFNQSFLIAYHFFKNIKGESLEFHADWLIRVRATLPQTELSLPERLVNLDDAFQAPPEVRGKRILLLDDVMTTGSTLNAAAHGLQMAGAEKVGALVLCRRTWEDEIDDPGW